MTDGSDAWSTAPVERQLTDQGRDRRQQLLDAAERLFAQRGFEQTRIADICEEAGVAKGLFYWYFDTKQALFADLVRSVRQQLRRAQAAAMDDAADPITRLCQGGRASVRFMSEHMEFFTLVRDVGRDAGREGSIAPVLAESAEIYIADIERLIEKAQADGLVAADRNARLLALAVQSTVSSFAGFQRHGVVSGSVEDLADFVASWLERALRDR